MLPSYEEVRLRYQERLDEAKLQRLVKQARAERANTFKQSLDALLRRFRPLFTRRAASHQPRSQGVAK
jgi:hypothetical protein